MAFSSIIRALGRSPLTTELLSKLDQQRYLQLNGIPRLPKGLVASALAQAQGQNLFVVCATLEEVSRCCAQLEAMGWQTVHFYPTSEASPYEPFDPESEMTWGQMQVLADLVRAEVKGLRTEEMAQESKRNPTPLTPTTSSLSVPSPQSSTKMAVVATERALQLHLPPPEAFKPFCITLERGQSWDLDAFSKKVATLGYERVPLVEMEGQWSRRGDIIDVFPVSAELPVRLEWFGDELDQMREFDPATQRSLDKIERLVLTPTDFSPIVRAALEGMNREGAKGAKEEEGEREERGERGERGEKSTRRLLGVAFEHPASLLDYLPQNTLLAIDEPEQCRAHSDRWVEHAEEQWAIANGKEQLPKIHRNFDQSLAAAERFKRLYLSELVESSVLNPQSSALNLASRPVPVTPHQFAKIAETLRNERDRSFSIWIVSAQPSRSVSLLQEHDCPAQF
ncbi:MAG: transcription-repair coupling factor, partial [Cyanobacteriota bacterium]